MSTPSSQNHPVYWIGGSFSGGKSTTTRLLAEWHDMATYHLDWHLLKDPVFTKFRVKDANWFWMPNDRKMERYPPAFPTAVSQIDELSRARSVVVEGPGLLPHLLASYDVAPEHVIYLLPTPSFQRRMNRQRGDWVERTLAPFAEPEEAWEEWMQLDEQFADLIEASATAAGYRCVRNDGELSAEGVVQLVEQHFGLVGSTA